MLLLNVTTDKIQVITGQAVTVDVHSSFIDQTNNADPPVIKGTTSGRLNTAITTATTTDIVAAPAASTMRNVKTINIRNKHASASVDITVQFNQNATLFELHKVTLIAGACLQYIEGIGWFVVQPLAPTILMKVLTADDAGGTNVATAQPWFPTAGGVTVPAATTYYMDGQLFISRAAGTTSHTIGLLFGGTATLTSIQYIAGTNVGDVETLLPESRVESRVATNTPVTAASIVATEQKQIKLNGIVRINAAGTFIPQFIYSAAPGGTPTIKANSFFRLTPLGDNNFASQGVWA
jgi:hypothetical protein